MFTFVLDSDLHYGKKDNGGPRSGKKDNPHKISQEDDVDFVVVAGDLTENGYDGKRLCCFRYGGFSDQLKLLREQYVEPIEGSGIPVKLCIGNHDRGRPPYIYQPVFGYVKERHGGIQYVFDHKGYRFICCSMYPKDTKWLKKRLRKNKPNVIYFHYNLAGSWSDWWSEKEKDRFYDAVKSYPISAILVGHSHSNNHFLWKEINVVMCASDGYAKITCSGDGSITVEFKTRYRVIQRNH